MKYWYMKCGFTHLIFTRPPHTNTSHQHLHRPSIVITHPIHMLCSSQILCHCIAQRGTLIQVLAIPCNDHHSPSPWVLQRCQVSHVPRHGAHTLCHMHVVQVQLHKSRPPCVAGDECCGVGAGACLLCQLCGWMLVCVCLLVCGWIFVCGWMLVMRVHPYMHHCMYNKTHTSMFLCLLDHHSSFIITFMLGTLLCCMPVVCVCVVCTLLCNNASLKHITKHPPYIYTHPHYPV